MTGNDLVYAGFRVAGILGAADRSLSASDTNDGLRCLTAMLDSWRADRLMVYAQHRWIFPLTANQGSYAIGENADWNAPRPVKIEQATLVLNNATPPTEIPLRNLTQQEWAVVSLKGLKSTLPWACYYEPQVPNGVFYLYPVPTDQTNQIAVWLWQLLQIIDLAQPIQLAPAYQEAIEYNLALRLSARYPERQKMSATALQIARDALRNVKSINAPSLLAQVESGGRESGGRNQGTYNIYNNSYTPSSGGY